PTARSWVGRNRPRSERTAAIPRRWRGIGHVATGDGKRKVSCCGSVVTIRWALWPTPDMGSYCTPAPEEGAPAHLVQLVRMGRPPASGRAAGPARGSLPFSLRRGRLARSKGSIMSLRHQLHAPLEAVLRCARRIAELSVSLLHHHSFHRDDLRRL